MYSVKLPVRSDPIITVTPIIAICQSRSRKLCSGFELDLERKMRKKRKGEEVALVLREPGCLHHHHERRSA